VRRKHDREGGTESAAAEDGLLASNGRRRVTFCPGYRACFVVEPAGGRSLVARGPKPSRHDEHYNLSCQVHPRRLLARRPRSRRRPPVAGCCSRWMR